MALLGNKGVGFGNRLKAGAKAGVQSGPAGFAAVGIPAATSAAAAFLGGGDQDHWATKASNSMNDVLTLGVTKQFREAKTQQDEAKQMLADLGERPSWDQLRETNAENQDQLLSNLDDVRGKNALLANQGLPQESKDLYSDMANRMLASSLNRNTATRGGTGGINDIADSVLQSYRQISAMDAEQRLANKTRSLDNELNYLNAENSILNQGFDQEMTMTGSDMDYWGAQQDYIRQLMSAGKQNEMAAVKDARNMTLDVAKTAVTFI